VCALRSTDERHRNLRRTELRLHVRDWISRVRLQLRGKYEREHLRFVMYAVSRPGACRRDL
jgi:hypothetical protein